MRSCRAPEPSRALAISTHQSLNQPSDISVGRHLIRISLRLSLSKGNTTRSVNVKLVDGVFPTQRKHALAGALKDVIVKFEGFEAFR